MSTDYYIELAVGFEIHINDLLAPFEKISPEKSHLEDRYDEKTGKKLDPVRVVDQEEQVVWKINGEEFDCEDSAADAVADKVNAVATYGYGTIENVVIGPPMPLGEESNESTWSHFTTGPNYSFRSLAKMGSKLDEIAKELKKLGIESGRAKFVLVRSMS
jgi:hypothetical protein